MILKRIKAGEDEVRRINMTELDASFNAANNAAPSPISPLKSTGAKTAKGPVFATQGFDLEESMEETISNINTIRPYNQRIDLNLDGENVYNVAESSNVRGGLLDNGIVGGLGVGAGNDDNGPDLDDDELTRDKVKRASTQILLAMDKKKKKQSKKKGGNGGEHGHGNNAQEETASPSKSPFRG